MYYLNLNRKYKFEKSKIFLFHHAGVEYSLQKIAEDKKDEILVWYGSQKKELSSTKNPICNLPYIVTDEGEYITETIAIMIYLGEKYGYYGENIIEKTRINQILMRLVDFRADIRDNIMLCPKSDPKKSKFAGYGQGSQSMAKYYRNYLGEIDGKFHNSSTWNLGYGLSTYLQQFENCFKLWKNEDFLCSDKISVADIMLFQMLDKVLLWKPDALKRYVSMSSWYHSLR